MPILDPDAWEWRIGARTYTRPAGGSMPTYRILIVDDSDTFRVAAEVLLASDERFEVVGRAASGREGLAEAVRLRPDLVLMDLSMSDMDGLEATLRLARLPDAPPVVIMTSHDQPEYREAAEK